MINLIKVLFLFKEPTIKLNEVGLLTLGVARLVLIISSLFIIGFLAQTAGAYIPILKPYSEYLTLPSISNNIFLSSFISGLLTMVWGLVGCVILYLTFGLLYFVLLFLGGGFTDE